MTPLALPPFTADRPAAEVDTSLRQALAACDRARECAVLWFAEVQRRHLHRHFGYASLEAYATDALGFTANRYWQFKRLADDLDRLPALREAVAAGDVGWTKAQQVARVATTDTQAAWVARARRTGRRELEQEVRAACGRARARVEVAQLELGATAPPALAPEQQVPTALRPAERVPAELAPVKLAPAQAPAAPVGGAPAHTITLRVDALQLARFEALVEKARKQRRAPTQADRAEIVLQALAALVEGGTDREGTAHRAAHPATQVIVHQCPACAGATVGTPRGELPLAPAQVAAVACDARIRRPGRRNTAAIAPRLRAEVLARDRHRCAAPGCGSTRFLEVHHLVPRRAGGANEPGNLVTLCHRCHAFAHEHEKGAAALFAGRQEAGRQEATRALAPAQVGINAGGGAG